MKTIAKNLAKVTVTAVMLSLSMGLFESASAQSVRLPGNDLSEATPNSTQGLVLATELDPRATNMAAMDARSSNRAMVGSQSLTTELPKAVDQAMSLLSIEKLMQGEAKATVVVGGSVSLLDEQAISVKVNFEARPVGGILTVRASMSPSFRGVGVSTRPEISRSVAMAVDELNEAQIKDIVRELTAEINGEFAHAGSSN
jgi:hypothetical protein